MPWRARGGGPMTRADREHRALRRDMLLVRAAAERAEFTTRLDAIDATTRTGRAVVGAMLGRTPENAGGLLRVAASVVRIARSRPWILPAVIGTVARVGRSRALRWIVLGGAVATAIWWLSRQRSASFAFNDSPSELPTFDDDA